MNFKFVNDFKVFIEYSNNMDDIFINFGEHSPEKKCKKLTAFDDVIADMVSKKKI